MVRILLLVVGLLTCAGRVEAACDTSGDPILVPASNAISDIQDCENVATSGDTIDLHSATVNSGNATLTIDTCIILQGDGTGNTIFNDTRTSDSNTYLVVYNIPDECTTARITAIQFKWTSADTDTDALYYLNVNGLNDERRIRIDNNRFDCNGDADTSPGEKSAAVILADTVIGVFDHNTVIGCQTAWLGFVKGSLWDTGVDNDGDRSWADSDGEDFGSVNFFFFEDNTLTLASSIYQLTMLDAQAGGRYVFRYNTVTQGSIEGHGLEAERERSTRACEVYRNTWTGIDAQEYFIYTRGGVCLIHHNGLYGYGATPKMNLLNNRSSTALAAPFGGMDGRNPWDVNDDANNPYETGICDSVAAGTCTDTGRSFSNYAGYVIRATSGNSCGGAGTASLSRSGSTVTVTCNGHGYSNGNIVGVWGADQTAYNGTWSIINVTANTFQYSINFTPDAATGTIRVRLGNYFSEISSNTGTAISYEDSIYAVISTDYNLNFLAGDTFEILKVLHPMDGIGRAGGSLLSGTKVALPAGWNDQTTSPWYEWNNLKCPSSPPTVDCASGTDIDFVAINPVIVIGTHAINDTEKPGYTEYTHPHPLVSGEAEPAPASGPVRLRLRSDVADPSGAASLLAQHATPALPTNQHVSRLLPRGRESVDTVAHEPPRVMGPPSAHSTARAVAGVAHRTQPRATRHSRVTLQTSVPTITARGRATNAKAPWTVRRMGVRLLLSWGVYSPTLFPSTTRATPSSIFPADLCRTRPQTPEAA